MSTISQFMQQHHRDCDDLFARAEASATDGDWSNTASHWAGFCQLMEYHLRMEEEVLFPAFEAQTGQTQGPTMVMRMEHQQVRALLAEMSSCLEGQNQERFLGLAESLMVLIQQHNMKEEQMLYPMTDRALADATAVLTQMQELGDP
jgi:iron-sulfur cluster repair protein YtfE (RIC family)